MDRRMRRWRPRRPWVPPLIGIIAVLTSFVGPFPPQPVVGAYQATADSNVSAFNPPCLGWNDPHPARMLTLATSAMTALGYSVTGYKGAAFTKAHTLARTVGDWSYYVHSHGDYYWYAPLSRRYSGFREDAGTCTQNVVFSNEIAARRAGRATNLVVISTCFNGDANATLPAAFGIAQTKAGVLAWSGPKFYLGFVGEAYDNDEETFETIFWDALTRGKGVGPAFDLAMLGGFTHASFDADWWGSYIWSGRAGQSTPCTRCL